MLKRLLLYFIVMIICTGCANFGPSHPLGFLGAMSAFTGIGYPSDEEIYESYIRHCLTLEKIELNSNPEYSDTLIFEGGVTSGSVISIDSRDLVVGNTYQIRVSHFWKKKGDPFSRDSEGNYRPFVSCQKK